jgi:hypothetical protein
MITVHKDSDDWTDDQHEIYLKYKTDPLQVGRLCKKFPTLENAWNQFKNTLELCKSQDDTY